MEHHSVESLASYFKLKLVKDNLPLQEPTEKPLKG